MPGLFTDNSLKKALVPSLLIQTSNLRFHRSLELRVFGWLEKEAAQNLGLPIPGDHTSYLHIAKPSPSGSAQMQKFSQRLTLVLQKFLSSMTSQVWNYHVFSPQTWALMLQSAFKKVMLPRSIGQWLEPEAWAARDPIYCSALLQVLVLAINRGGRRSLALSLLRDQKGKEEPNVEIVISLCTYYYPWAWEICAENTEP